MSEAALSFLGFGLPPEVPSWGGMLSREGHQYMEMARQAWRSGLDFARRLSSTLSTCLEVPSGILFDPRLRGGEGSHGAAGKRKRGLLSRLLNPFS